MSAALFISPETAKLHRRDVRKALFLDGWQYLDGGSYSSVWKSPDGSRVIKVTKPDRGSDATTAAAMAHPSNPFLPAIFATSRLACGGSMTEVELLDSVSYADPDYNPVDTAARQFERGEVDAVPMGALREALTALDAEADRQGLDPDNRWDTGARNTMRRRNADGTSQIVITDFLYDKETLIFGAGWAKGTAHDAASVAKDTDAKVAA